MSNENTQADGAPLVRQVRPVCYGDGFGYGEPRMTNRYKYRLFTQAEIDAAVAAERQRLQPGRDELVAAWNDLPDALRCHPGLKRLYAAAQRA